MPITVYQKKYSPLQHFKCRVGEGVLPSTRLPAVREGQPAPAIKRPWAACPTCSFWAQAQICSPLSKHRGGPAIRSQCRFHGHQQQGWDTTNISQKQLNSNQHHKACWWLSPPCATKVAKTQFEAGRGQALVLCSSQRMAQLHAVAWTSTAAMCCG